MLSNFTVGGDSLFQSFLLGQPQFKETLADPALEQFRQRVIASYHLGPMLAEETADYIRHRLRLVGWVGDPEIAEDAFALIHRHSGGVPRRINTLCGRLLLYGALEGLHRIDTAAVEAVIADLGNEVTEAASLRAVAAQVGVQVGNGAVPADLEQRLEKLADTVTLHDRTLRQLMETVIGYMAVEAGRSDEP